MRLSDGEVGGMKSRRDGRLKWREVLRGIQVWIGGGL